MSKCWYETVAFIGSHQTGTVVHLKCCMYYELQHIDIRAKNVKTSFCWILIVTWTSRHSSRTRIKLQCVNRWPNLDGNQIVLKFKVQYQMAKSKRRFKLERQSMNLHNSVVIKFLLTIFDRLNFRVGTLCMPPAVSSE